MTRVEITDDAITVSGHSGYAPPGHDIVCAGISALTGMLIETLPSYGLRDEDVCVRSGFVEIRLGNVSPIGWHVLSAYYHGVKAIARDYAAYAEVVDDVPTRIRR